MRADEPHVCWRDSRVRESELGGASQGLPGAIRRGDVHRVGSGAEAPHVAERFVSSRAQRQERYALTQSHAVALDSKRPRYARCGRFQRVEAGRNPRALGVVPARDHQLAVLEL